MNNKFRDELREALDNSIENGPWRDDGALVKAARHMLALLSGTHKTHWLAPREPTYKMRHSLGNSMHLSGSQIEFLRNNAECDFKIMRDASEKERKNAVL